MADNTDDAMKDPDILQHLSEAHLQNPMARESFLSAFDMMVALTRFFLP